VLVGLLPPPQLLASKAIEIQVAEGTAIFRATRWNMQDSVKRSHYPLSITTRAGG